MGERGVLHVLHGQSPRLEGAVRPHVIRDLQAPLPGPVEGHVFEEIDGTDKFSVSHLETGCNDTGRTIEPGRVRCLKGAGHEWAIVAAAHPSADQVPECEGLQHFSQGR